MNFEQRLIDICDQICAHFGWDMHKEIDDYEQTGSRKITAISNLKQTIYKAREEAHKNCANTIEVWKHFTVEKHGMS